VEPGEVGELDQDERARRGLEAAAGVGRGSAGVDAEQLADGGGEDADRDPVEEGGESTTPARPQDAGDPPSAS
jgi:hypothetical protein